MKIFEFNKYFPDESACRRKFKEMRDKEGVTCQHCSSNDVVWLESKQQYQCKHCRHRTTLRSGTVMHGSKLPFRYWFIAMHLLTATKKSISTAELQRQLGHNRYQQLQNAAGRHVSRRKARVPARISERVLLQVQSPILRRGPVREAGNDSGILPHGF